MPRKIPMLCPGGSNGRVPAGGPPVGWAKTGIAAKRIRKVTVIKDFGKSSGFIQFSPDYKWGYSNDAHM
jgi:hypothetical protein